MNRVDGEMFIHVLRHAVLLLTIVCVGLWPGVSSGDSNKQLRQLTEELRRSPDDIALREKIIKTALKMKPAPTISEEAERHIVRGVAFFTKATDATAYKKAIDEFQAAADAAPWLATAYYNLGVAQEKAGLYAEAIQSLKLYLLAAPNAKNAREVKNQIYALEVDVEEVAAGRASQAVAAKEQTPGLPRLSIEPVKRLKIAAIPTELKAKAASLEGAWYYKDELRGETVTVHAFTISKNENGDLVAAPPKRGADTEATIPEFVVTDRKVKLTLDWRMTTVTRYWKVETYDLSLSDDGRTLAGSYTQKSNSGRNVYLDRTLFRQ